MLNDFATLLENFLHEGIPQKFTKLLSCGINCRILWIFVLSLTILILSIWFLFSLPEPLFTTPSSTVLLDKDGNLLGAKIAVDGQWRFPAGDTVPDKFKKAIIQFEDRHFYLHPGINPLSMARALLQNIRAGKIKRGGSTMTMQVIRLARKGKKRTIFEKFIEIFFALRLELWTGKNKIIALYASHAPYGGNVVGLDAAAWRYFGRRANQLSWAEATTLAVLPNSPSLIYPGHNHEKLGIKRNRLLQQLWKTDAMDSLSCRLAMNEPLPGKPFPLPQLAPHLLARAERDGLKGKIINSSLDARLQERVAAIIEKHHSILLHNGINNAAAIVLDIEKGHALAYIGNTRALSNEQNGNDVDIITAPRSTGSILKPFLFMAMLKEGVILSTMLLPDIPTYISGYSPKNFSPGFDGAVPAKRALSRSLNVPAVRMLQEYGIEKFHRFLQNAGMTTLNKPAGHYGLSIILGGAEGTLWDIAGIYGSMARTLNHFRRYSGRYDGNDFHPPSYLNNDVHDTPPIIEKGDGFTPQQAGFAAAVWLTFESMVEVSRPDEEINWQIFSSLGKIAWKTGTSFGFRDGWAVGCTPRYVVGVWTGNADGEGRPGLTGIATAAPVMFDIFRLLETEGWFSPPYDEMARVALCRQSGFRASDICVQTDSVWIQNPGLKTPPCPFHKMIHLDRSGRWRVTSDCEAVEKMHNEPWFILPPVQEWYYKSKNPSYAQLPPYRPDCMVESQSNRNMDLIYPKNFSKIFVPVELDGTPGKTVFEAAHRNVKATVYWHMDNEYIGSTVSFHQFALRPSSGKHVLTLIDENGEMIVAKFEIVSK